MTQKLTVREVALNARKAYDEKRLGAQIPNNSDCQYIYPEVGPEYGCAIGVTLNEESKAQIRANTGEYNNASVCALDRIVTYDFEDLRDLMGIQDRHDRWAACCDDLGRKDKESAFVNYIDEIIEWTKND